MKMRPSAASGSPPVPTSTTELRITNVKWSNRSMAWATNRPNSSGPVVVRAGAVTVSTWTVVSGRNTSGISDHARRVTMSA
jgi:hypothetical protein